MIYIKKEFNGIELKFDAYSDEFYTKCPMCGKEVNLCVDMLRNSVEDLSGVSWYCKECANQERMDKLNENRCNN